MWLRNREKEVSETEKSIGRLEYQVRVLKVERDWRHSQAAKAKEDAGRWHAKFCQVKAENNRLRRKVTRERELEARVKELQEERDQLVRRNEELLEDRAALNAELYERTFSL